MVNFVMIGNVLLIFILLYYVSTVKRNFSKSLRLPLLLVGIITLAEYSFSYSIMYIGVTIHILIILFGIFSFLIFKGDELKIVQSFALISLLRLVNGALPMYGIFVFYQFLLIYSFLFLSSMLMVYYQGHSLKDIGIMKRGMYKYSAAGILLGFFYGFSEYSVLGEVDLLPYFLLSSFFIFFILGITEELVFRGVLQTNLEKIDAFSALILSAVVFSIMHSIWLDTTEYLFTFYVGLMLGAIYLKTRSLVCPIVAHTVINFTLFQIIPFYWG